MPKTVEELEQELKSQKANYEGQIAKLTTEVEAKNKEIEEVKAHAVALEKGLEGFRKAEREALEERFHAVTKDLSEEQKKKIEERLGPIDKLKNSEIESFVAGFEVIHAIPKNEPHRSKTTPPIKNEEQDSRTEAVKFLDGDL